MKNFDKWFKKNKPYKTYSCMDMAEKVWQAALKWVLEKENNVEPRWREEYLPERYTLAVYDIIREELDGVEE